MKRKLQSYKKKCGILDNENKMMKMTHEVFEKEKEEMLREIERVNR